MDRIVNDIAVIDSKHVNIKQIINMKQVINQIAIQVAVAGGNASQVINQLDPQASKESGKKVDVDRFMGQLAHETAEGDITTVNQTINRMVEKTVTSGGNASLGLSQLPEQIEQQNRTEVPESQEESINSHLPTQGNATQGNVSSTQSAREAPKGHEQQMPEGPTEFPRNDTAQGKAVHEPAKGGQGNTTSGQ